MFALALAAATRLVYLDNGGLRLTVPVAMRISRRRAGFEVDFYDLHERRQGPAVLNLFVGGGAYDLKGYRHICLNGRQAWEHFSGNSGALVVGEPGRDAVDAFYAHLPSAKVRLAQRIIASLRFNAGHICKEKPR